MPKRIIIFGAAFAVVVGGLGRSVPAPDRAVAGDPPSKQLTRLYFGVNLCRKCHNEKQSVPDNDALLYRGIEMSTWDQLDKHKDATAVLKNERSQQIGKILGWPDVRNDRRCLTCHGVVPASEKEVHEASFSPAQREESGVSCVVCHGAVKEWVDSHATVTGGDAWKKLTRAEKQRDYGLRDLWDPAVRAALCCSCHVGSAAEGKVVTHEMYAAGHPPLPGIEISTFSDAMPRHWENLSEKVARRPQHKAFHQRVHGFAAAADEVEIARLLAISSTVAFRTSLQLVHDLANREATEPNVQEPVWPELAAFDCAACHHELKSGAWRQLRWAAGRPGRPMLRTWPVPLMDSNVAFVARHGQAALATEHRQLLKELTAALDKAPFGDPRTMAAQSQALIRTSDRLLKELQAPTTRFDRTAAHEFLMALLRRPEQELLDFDAARQIGWGVRALLPALEPGWNQRDNLKSIMGRLQDQLQLELPMGQVSIAKEFLPQVLQRISAYDPRFFHESLRALTSALDNSGR